LGTHYLLGSANQSSLAPFNWNTANWTGQFPTIPAGNYYVVAFLDPNNSIPEFDDSTASNQRVLQGSLTVNNVIAPTISLTVSPTSVPENGTANLIYTFSRSGSTTAALNNVNFRVGGTATFNNDYTQTGAAAFTGTTGSINFAAGSATARVTLDPRGDTTVEPNETATLTLATGTGYTVAIPSAATGTITNDDRVSVSTFRNTTNLIINDNAPGTPYPSNINVSGITGTITKVTATLKGVSHTWPTDLDILLTGPNGQKVMLMSDAGVDLDINRVNLVFDSSARATLPDSNQIVSGTYRPTNFDTTTDTFASPAPGGPYGTNLGVFNGISPNGAWKLFVRDDLAGDVGAIAQGWELAIQTA
jgi:subtilisin-like proprotein convertase family protein